MVLLLVLNLPLAPLWAKLLQIPRPYLYAGSCSSPASAPTRSSGQPVDLVMLLAIGAIGFLMRRYGLPVLPAIIGVILGPDAELQLRRALQIANGDWTTLISTPLAVIIYLVILVLLLLPAIRALRRRGRDGGPTDPDHSEPAGAGRSAQS